MMTSLLLDFSVSLRSAVCECRTLGEKSVHLIITLEVINGFLIKNAPEELPEY